MPWTEDDIAGSGGEGFEYDFTIRKAYFGHDSRYNEGNTPLLILEGEKDWGSGGDDDAHLFVKIGSFEPGDDEGTFAIHESQDPEIAFHARSHIQEFIKRAVELGWPGPEKGDNSRQAKIWVGSRFHIVGEPRSFTNDEGEKVEYEVQLPDTYLGEVGEEEESKAASSDGDVTKLPNSADDVDRKLKLVAKKSDNYLDFLDEATTDLGLEVDDPRVAEEGKESVWAQVKS